MVEMSLSDHRETLTVNHLVGTLRTGTAGLTREQRLNNSEEMFQ